MVLLEDGLSSGNTQDAFDVDITFCFSHIVNFRNAFQFQYINKINSTRSCSDFAGLKLKVSAMKGYFNTLR